MVLKIIRFTTQIGVNDHTEHAHDNCGGYHHAVPSNYGYAFIFSKKLQINNIYCLRSTTILAALANAMFLLIACGAIAWEAIQRFSYTPEVVGLMVTQVAGIGIFINGFSAWLSVKGSKDDLNIRGAYLHMAADAAISLWVVLAGIGMMFSSWCISTGATPHISIKVQKQ